jgi:hypothetical protein
MVRKINSTQKEENCNQEQNKKRRDSIKKQKIENYKYKIKIS